jgi:hypothetical protein
VISFVPTVVGLIKSRMSRKPSKKAIGKHAND